MIGRRTLLFLALLSVATLGLAGHATASGGMYHVLKCHPSQRLADELSQSGEHSSYERVNQCGPQFADPKFGIYNDGAAPNTAYEQFMYVAPPATSIRRACLQYNLRRQSHHRAEIFAYPGFDLLASGGEDPAGWSGTQCWYLNHQQVVVRLSCAQAGGCPEGSSAHAYVRNVQLDLEDLSDPDVTSLAGTLFKPGWIRGAATVQAEGTDAGSGVSNLVLNVNGAEIGRRPGDCADATPGWPYAALLAPCSPGLGFLDMTLDTASSPFQAGANVVRAGVLDYAGNSSRQEHMVLVDNSPPSVAFSNSQDPDEPELIRAAVSDPHSGVASAQIYYRRIGTQSWSVLDTTQSKGEARTQIDSSALPAGDYEFRAEASDVAGNVATTSLRQNGTPMRLRFPLRFDSEIRARVGRGGAERQTVAYGTGSAVYGQLTDGSGAPLPHEPIVVEEHFGDGALIRERPTAAVTDRNGKFETKVPAGPSRRISVRFSGSQKYLPAHEAAGTLLVRTRASLKTSRDQITEGHRLVFAGKVAHFGARIPAGGKLVELQVRIKPGEWDTVREAFRTDGNGRYRLGYRFGRHYVSDALFRFRVKVRAEGDWPFTGATTPERKVIVHPDLTRR